MSARHRFEDYAACRAYALGGRALLTLKSKRTGKHFTYRITKAPRHRASYGNAEKWFVAVIHDGDNNGRGRYLGAIDPVRGFVATQASPSGGATASLAFRGFAWFWRYVERHELPDRCEAWHEGTCGRCGRRLTHPESIETGIGPICAEKG